MKKRIFKKVALFTVFLGLSLSLFAQKAKKPIKLLDDKLTYWYTWIGAPHKTVKDLPQGTPTGDGFSGVPMGLNDVKGVFKSEKLNGERVLHVSGEIYGGLTTKLAYENYHLQLKYKWGTKKWAPRLKLPKDCGIMYHLTGTNEDALWGAFMMGLECQICEKTTGEVFFVMNKNMSLRPLADARIGDKNKFDVNAPIKQVGGYVKMGSVIPSENYESDSTQWTTVDLYTIGNSAIYLVNGHVVNALTNAGVQKADKSITPLTKGKIQLQSEGAEVYYKDVTIQFITDFPADIKKAAGFNP